MKTLETAVHKGTEFVITDDGDLRIAMSASFTNEFRTLCQRGAGLWPDASAEMKRFVDYVTLGKLQQEYSDDSAQRFQYRHICKCGYVTVFRTRSAKPPEDVICDRPGKIEIEWHNRATGERGVNQAECKLRLPFRDFDNVSHIPTVDQTNGGA